MNIEKNINGLSMSTRLNRRRFLKLAAMGLGAAALPVSLGRAAGTSSALLFSDLHFNPFFDPTLMEALQQADYSGWAEILAGSADTSMGDYLLETNYRLLASGLDSMAALCPSTSYIIFTGDILAHHFNELFHRHAVDKSDAARLSFITKTVAFLGHELRRRWPSAVVPFCLGNNDSYCGDYQIEPAGPFLQNTAAAYSGLYLGPGYRAADFDETFIAGGYYALSLGRLRIIAMNNIFMSKHYGNLCAPPMNCTLGKDCDPATIHLDWLEDQFMAARDAGQRVWLLLHIPPGVNTHSTLHHYRQPDGSLSQVKLPMHREYNDRLVALLRVHGSLIAAGFCGHTHMDDFRLIRDEALNKRAMAWLHITPAMNSRDGNNPSFQLMNYDAANFEPLEYTTYYMDYLNQRWLQEYKFAATYGLGSPLTASVMQKHYEAFRFSTANQERYCEYYPVSSPHGFSRDDIKGYLVGTTHLTAKDYLAAYARWPEPPR
jgi:sphingomyelin phosphodiesterase acid-like 3